jgi:hypothetical protein
MILPKNAAPKAESKKKPKNQKTKEPKRFHSAFMQVQVDALRSGGWRRELVGFH